VPGRLRHPHLHDLDDHEDHRRLEHDRECCDNVFRSPLVMRIVQNGLVAYSLCQALVQHARAVSMTIE